MTITYSQMMEMMALKSQLRLAQAEIAGAHRILDKLRAPVVDAEGKRLSVGRRLVAHIRSVLI